MTWAAFYNGLIVGLIVLWVVIRLRTEPPAYRDVCFRPIRLYARKYRPKHGGRR